MISDQQKQFLIKMFQMAIASGHMYPQFAACEAVEETGWGTTQAYLSANNVFGQKAPSALGRDDKVAILPTWEVFNGVKVRCTSHFMIYDSISDAFKARMALLRNLPSFYAPALAAMTGEEFIREVCAQWTRVEPTQAIIEGKFYQQFSDGRYEFVHGRWSTDPRR